MELSGAHVRVVVLASLAAVGLFAGGLIGGDAGSPLRWVVVGGLLVLALVSVVRGRQPGTGARRTSQRRVLQRRASHRGALPPVPVRSVQERSRAA
ncbi:hypothetical protein [Nocardioides sp. SYSU D00038]|uniref:hypothetical protein n=1 Tax=Nocardioides sp. SYSU D00038 TaxID=2812554 RepID=UPI001967816C|nr:hypothetical protein [Nocardioides sp. SYSU D00038]